MRRLMLAAVLVLLTTGCVGSGGGLSEAEKSYLDTASTMLTVLGDSVLRFSDLAKVPRIGEPAWTQAVSDELYLWKAAYTDAPNRLRAPDGLEDLHADFMTFLALLNGAADDNLTGLERLDVDQILSGQAKIEQATPLAADLREQIRTAREDD